MGQTQDVLGIRLKFTVSAGLPQEFIQLCFSGRPIFFFKIGQPEIITDIFQIFALGEIRFRKNGGPGTHNGLKSIVEVLGEEFLRLRIGIGTQPAGADLAAWVLSAPSPEEEKIFEQMLKQLPEKIRSIVVEGE